MSQSVMDALAEEWRPVAGWPSYEVSNFGYVRRCVDVDTKGRRVALRVLRPRITGDGYAMVALRDGKRQRSYRVHGLVLRAFAGEPAGREANHKDGDRLNNALSNLEWVTHAENVRATYAAGRGVQQKPGYLNPMRAEARAARRTE